MTNLQGVDSTNSSAQAFRNLAYGDGNEDLPAALLIGGVHQMHLGVSLLGQDMDIVK